MQQQQTDGEPDLKHSSTCTDPVRRHCPLIRSLTPSLSPLHHFFPSSSPSSFSPTPNVCLFPSLTSSAGFSTLLSLRVLLSTSLPRCAKWKLLQRPGVAIVTCHSNHSPSCVSPSRQRGCGGGSGRPRPRSAAPKAGSRSSNLPGSDQNRSHITS